MLKEVKISKQLKETMTRTVQDRVKVAALNDFLAAMLKIQPRKLTYRINEKGEIINVYDAQLIAKDELSDLETSNNRHIAMLYRERLVELRK